MCSSMTESVSLITGESVAMVKFRLPATAGEGSDERSAVCDGVEEALVVLAVGGIEYVFVEDGPHDGVDPTTVTCAALRGPPSD